MSLDPRVYVFTNGNRLPDMVAEGFPGPNTLTIFRSGSELLAACAQVPPLLVIAEILNGQEGVLLTLQRMSEMVNAPRRLLLAEPGIIEDVLVETFRAGEDSLVLWPCSAADLSEAVRGMFIAPVEAPMHGDITANPSLQMPPQMRLGPIN